MTEEQLRAFLPFRRLPVYDESDEQADTITSGDGKIRKLKECTTVSEVEECLKNPNLSPLGALRVGTDGQKVVVVYFGEKK